jgi:hypothetical protein
VGQIHGRALKFNPQESDEMCAISFLALIQQAEVYSIPTFFAPVVITLLVGGAIGWLIAAVLGFSRARRAGLRVSWFALSAACLVLFHLQLLLLGLGMLRNDAEMTLGVGAFFNLFVVLGAIFAIIGFSRSNL